MSATRIIIVRIRNRSTRMAWASGFIVGVGGDTVKVELAARPYRAARGESGQAIRLGTQRRLRRFAAIKSADHVALTQLSPEPIKRLRLS